jgi:hypothetical protein
MTNRAAAGAFVFFILGGGATASASALTPHRPVAVASRESIAESGQGLPSFPKIVDAAKPSVIGVRTRVAPVGRKDNDQRQRSASLRIVGRSVHSVRGSGGCAQYAG